MKRSKVSFMRAIKLMIKNSYNHNVLRNAAALAFHLLFALFPILIFISNLLGLINFNVFSLTQNLSGVLPVAVIDLIETFFYHIANSSSETLLWFSLVFSIWFPLRAVSGLMEDVRRAYGMGMSKSPVQYILRQLICTLVLLLLIVVTLFLAILGENMMKFLIGFLVESVDISVQILRIWHYLRFAIIGVFAFITIGIIYGVALERKVAIRSLLPGILSTMISWIVVNIGFSFYVENFADYSVIYGTLGAVMVVLVWLYLTSIILILGGEFNAALYYLKEGKQNDMYIDHKQKKD